jgi:hypothetical protein
MMSYISQISTLGDKNWLYIPQRNKGNECIARWLEVWKQIPMYFLGKFCSVMRTSLRISGYSPLFLIPFQTFSSSFFLFFFVYSGRRLSYHSCNPTLSKACMWWWLGSLLARFSRISSQQEWFENNSQEAKQTKKYICRQLLKQAEIIWRVGYGVIELIGVVASM